MNKTTNEDSRRIDDNINFPFHDLSSAAVRIIIFLSKSCSGRGEFELDASKIPHQAL
jgi:hypothetical protein